MRTIHQVLIGLTISALLPVAAAADRATYDYAGSQKLAHAKTFAFKASRQRNRKH